MRLAASRPARAPSLPYDVPRPGVNRPCRGRKKLDRSRSPPRIHEASARILENTGIWLDNEEAEDLLFCAEKAIPFLYADGANIGSSVPGTSAALA